MFASHTRSSYSHRAHREKTFPSYKASLLIVAFLLGLFLANWVG